LKRQVELSVENAQLTTYAFYNAERERLSTLVSTFSERPTLCKLINTPNDPELATYMEVLREGTSIDALFLVSNDQLLMSVSDTTDLPDPIFLRADRSLPFTDLVALENPQRLIVISADSVQDPVSCPLKSPAWLMAVQTFDDQDMRSLARQSGLEQSLLISGNRVATSLQSAPDWSLNPEAAEVVGQTLTSCCTSGASEAEKFYIGLAPLLDSQGTLVAISEIALPGNAIIRSAWNAVLLLFLSSLVIAFITVYVGISLTRRITRPLGDLVESAEQMSQGDLDEPIPTESGWIEINQLASQLEKSRRYLRNMLQVNQGEVKRLMNMLSAIREGENAEIQQEHEVELLDRSEEAANNKLRSEFFANMAHEFRTPLSSIAASIEMLSDEGSSMSSDEIAELTSTALMSTQHLQALVNNLLERFTIDAGVFRLRCQPILIQDVIQKNVEIMSPLLQRRKQRLVLAVPDDLPTVWADQDRLSQVFINLIENASKYSPFNTEITISAEGQGDRLLIAVLDGGPGIPQNQQEALFKPYNVINKPDSVQSGIGLGLSVVKAIIEAHGDQVGVENLPKSGTKIWFTLALGSLEKTG
jgi:signal transduction histidine kinase